MNISKTAIDECLWAIEKELWSVVGIDQASRDMTPLKWYVNTGRASVEFLRCLFSVKASSVAKILRMGGSDEMVIKAIKRSIRFDEKGERL